MFTKFRSEIPKGGDHLEDLGADGKIIFIIDPREVGWEDVGWT
jgi:hypothetical protein